MSAPARDVFLLNGDRDSLAAALGDDYRVTDATAIDVDGALADIVRTADGSPWLLVAHGGAGVVAAAVADRVLSGEATLFGLAGLVLVRDAGDHGGPMNESPTAIQLPVLDLDGKSADAATVASAIHGFWASTVEAAPPVPADWGHIIASDRTAHEARGLLARRALADDPDYAPLALTPEQLTTLRALADRLVPQRGPRIDLAARIDRDLSAGRGDGWRPPTLPDDASAYRTGLDAVASVWTDDAEQQDAVIEALIAGDGIDGAAWDGDTLRRWFEDVRNDLVRMWVAHPASLARIGYDGFATSGSGDGPPGFVALGAGVRDPWEPEGLGRLADGQGASGIHDEHSEQNEQNEQDGAA